MKKILAAFAFNLIALISVSVCLSLTAEEIVKLKKAGVSDKVILEILNSEENTKKEKYYNDSETHEWSATKHARDELGSLIYSKSIEISTSNIKYVQKLGFQGSKLGQPQDLECIIEWDELEILKYSNGNWHTRPYVLVRGYWKCGMNRYGFPSDRTLHTDKLYIRRGHGNAERAYELLKIFSK